MKWSISAHNAFRRCKRQYYFAHVLAHHNAQKEPFRREAYILKQLRNCKKWQGSLVEKGIEYYVLPEIKNKQTLNLDTVTNQVLDLGKRQFSFSKAKRYREPKMSKSSVNGEFCALFEHEYGEEINDIEIAEIFSNVTRCVDNLSKWKDLLNMLYKSSDFEIQKSLPFKLNGITVKSYIDLFLFSENRPIIIDWKVAESETSDNSKQMLIYSLACYKRYGVIPEVYEANLLKDEITHYTFTTDDLEEAEDFIFRSSKEIRFLESIEDFDFANSPMTCKYCNFKKLCLSFEHDLSLF